MEVRSEQAAALGDVDRLEFGVGSELVEDVLDVVADRRRLNTEGVGDVLGAGATCHQAQHLDLARRQLPNRIRRHRLAFVRGGPGLRRRGTPAHNLIRPDFGSRIEGFHQVDVIEAACTRAWRNDDGTLDFEHLPRAVLDLKFIRVNRLAVASHLAHRTAVVAETVAEQVPAANHTEAALADHARGLVAQQRLGCLVPDRDVPGLIAREGGYGGAGQ